MSRQRCDNCQQILALCFCGKLPCVEHKTTLVILQHVTEAKHAKNTAKLIGAISNNSLLINYDDNTDLSTLITKDIAQNAALLYPVPESQLLNPLCNDLSTFSKPYLIVIDATWRKAKRVFQQSTLLQTLPCYTLPLELPSEYAIRSVGKHQGLSTIEACGWAVQAIEGISVKPWLHTLRIFNESFLSQMPPRVKQRYK